MPTESVMQFRYQKRHVDASIRDGIEGGRFCQEEAIIAYVDQSTRIPDRDPVIVPCRFARVLHAERYGSAYVLQLQLGGFCRLGEPSRCASGTEPDYIAEFNRHISGSSAGQQPVWKDSKPQGKYWFRAEKPSFALRSSDLVEFENLVKELASHSDFGTEPLFYHIRSVRRTGEPHRLEAAISPKNGELLLDANRNYEIEVFQFHPMGNTDCRLLLQSGTPSLTITTNPTLYFASRYDIRRTTFRVWNPPLPQSEFPILDPEDPRLIEHTGSILSVFRLPKGAKLEDKEWEFDLPVRIKPDLTSVKSFGAVFGLLLAAPAMISIVVNDKLSAGARMVAVLIAALAGAFAGIMGALGLRRPST